MPDTGTKYPECDHYEKGWKRIFEQRLAAENRLDDVRKWRLDLVRSKGVDKDTAWVMACYEYSPIGFDEVTRKQLGLKGGMTVEEVIARNKKRGIDYKNKAAFKIDYQVVSWDEICKLTEEEFGRYFAFVSINRMSRGIKAEDCPNLTVWRLLQLAKAQPEVYKEFLILAKQLKLGKRVDEESESHDNELQGIMERTRKRAREASQK